MNKLVELRSSGLSLALGLTTSAASQLVESLPRFPCIDQINRKWNPPDKIIRQAQDEGRFWPGIRPDCHGQADWPKHLSQKPDGSQQPATLRRPRNFKVDDPVQSHDHSEALKDLRVIEWRETGKPEQPLGIVNGVKSPDDVVNAGQNEDCAMKSSARNHNWTSVYGFSPVDDPRRDAIDRDINFATP